MLSIKKSPARRCRQHRPGSKSSRPIARAESTQQAAAAKAANSPLAGFSLVCDPVYLKNDVDTAPAGAQKDLGAAQLVLETAIARTNGPSILWPYALAAMIGVFSAVPWFWYFLLRRLAELRQAVLGR
jgi:hypothetical protein